MWATLVHKQTQFEKYSVSRDDPSVLPTAQLATGQTFSFTSLG